jgi:hypothetical protein
VVSFCKYSSLWLVLLSTSDYSGSLHIIPIAGPGWFPTDEHTF